MSNFLRKYKMTLIGAVLIAGAFIAYRSYFIDDGKNSALVSQSGDEISGAEVGREIIMLLDELQDINIDGAVFSDPAFRSLIDFEQEVRAEPIGRNNPFIPIGNE